MAAQIQLLPCPRCGQKNYTIVEGMRSAVPATQPPIQTPTGYVLAQRARCGGHVLLDQQGQHVITSQGQYSFLPRGQALPQGWQLVAALPGQPPPPGMQVVQCAQLVDLPMQAKGHTCPNCQVTFGNEWIATTPAQVSGAQAPSVNLRTCNVEVPQGPNAGAEIAQRLGIGRPIS